MKCGVKFMKQGHEENNFDYKIGETVYLKEPYKGYTHVEITGYEGSRLAVRLPNGNEFTVLEEAFERESII